MTVTVYPSAPDTTLKVSKHRFLFTLHTQAQQIALDAFKARADQLTFAERLNTSPTATTSDSVNISALQGLSLAYRQMETLTELDLLSADMATFLGIAAALGVYGNDSVDEIARIKSNTPP